MIYVILIILLFFLFAKWPSFKSEGPFKRAVRRQRELREHHEDNGDDKKSG